MRKTLLRALAVARGAAAGRRRRRRWRCGCRSATSSSPPTAASRRRRCPSTTSRRSSCTATARSRPSTARRRRSCEQIILWFDKHGAVETRGLPVCTTGKLAATTTPQARKLCPGAIVGTGFGTAVVNFPEQAPIPASSPITIFNGPPKHGNPTVLAHAHLTRARRRPPSSSRSRSRRSTTAATASRPWPTIPKIAGGAGTPIYGRLTIGREWNYKGKTLSYANASCPDGRLQAKGQFRFKDGTFLQGTLLQSPARVAGEASAAQSARSLAGRRSALLACASAYAICSRNRQHEGQRHRDDAAARAARPRRRAGRRSAASTRIQTNDGSPPPTLNKLDLPVRQARLRSTPRACRSARWRSWPKRPATRRASAAPARWSARAPARPRSTCPASRRSDQLAALASSTRPPVGGKPSLIAHAYETVPAPKTLLVPIVDRTGQARPLRLPGPRSNCRRSPTATAPRPWPKRRIGRTLHARRQEVGYRQRPLRRRPAAGARAR